MNVTVKTFAQLREITQEGCFTLTLPDNATNMGDVISLLKSRSNNWAQALGASNSEKVDMGSNSNVLMARNQQLCDTKTLIQAGDELAFFPPVTGG
ncbi:Molybdopterin synthase subunit MoaD [Alteromonas sp. 38]|uniref:MoaD/ThiS family protein n=1 Tax=unclassified Alteromonas TaxID=2614992 RepID=UPI0012F1193C|nr:MULTISPECIES: MoaD/ThiS family protein [unclassified Alteromonas]CAD5271977.1 Molybdopterin synthase subunit MoaD [Alteromonas sp. 154]VXB50009.1 Molybdopterin synthase subunit MoaD [Alteromonas sp. 38]